MPQISRNDTQNRYEIREGNQLLGIAEFEKVTDRDVRMPHTKIEEGHAGQGLGSQLAKYALDDIRAQGYQVLPECPFIAAYIRKHTEYSDLVQG